MYSEPFCSSGSLTGDPFLVQVISGGGLPCASMNSVVGCPTDVFTSCCLILTTGTGDKYTWHYIAVFYLGIYVFINTGCLLGCVPCVV